MDVRGVLTEAFGRVTEMELMLASPGLVRRSNRSLGFLERPVWLRFPSTRIDILGVNGSRAQLTAWNGDEKSVTVSWSPTPLLATVKFAQFVGLIVNSGRSMLTWIERILIGTPPMICGI